jgi:hypothetical protein
MLVRDSDATVIFTPDEKLDEGDGAEHTRAQVWWLLGFGEWRRMRDARWIRSAANALPMREISTVGMQYK